MKMRECDSANRRVLTTGNFDAMPTIVCLCGSTRFYSEYVQANYDFTMAGYIVLSVGFFHHVKDEAHSQTTGITPAEKGFLDELHKRKIDLADEVFVINVDNYIGDSTKSEIAYALEHGKPVSYLKPFAGEYTHQKRIERHGLVYDIKHT